MIGYYVHHQGSGHRHRMDAVRAELGRLGRDVVALSSDPPPEGYDGEWVVLARDDLADEVRDATAHGRLHWAPRRDPGLSRRAAQLTRWMDRARPAALVVDVSVEVAALARLCGVPVVVVAMPGRRCDAAHRLAYDLADALVAAWPADVPLDWPAPWRAKAEFVGGISGFDRWSRPQQSAHDQEALLLCGSGGRSPLPFDLDEARAGTPGWTWRLAGGDRWLSRGEVWEALCRADVVVTHAGQNAVADVAAAQARAVVVADPRPFDEQHHTVGALQRLGLGVPLTSWPAADEWAALLERASRTDPALWRRWSHGDGAARAARVIEAVAA